MLPNLVHDFFKYAFSEGENRAIQALNAFVKRGVLDAFSVVPKWKSGVCGTAQVTVRLPTGGWQLKGGPSHRIVGAVG